MKFIIDNILLILTAITSGGLLLWSFIKKENAGLSSAVAVQLINRQRASLIDVSNPEEFAQAHAKGAKNIPLADLESKLAVAIKKKEAPIIFICPMGKRSAKAIKIAKKIGYSQVHHLAGGLKAWRDAHMPVEAL